MFNTEADMLLHASSCVVGITVNAIWALLSYKDKIKVYLSLHPFSSLDMLEDGMI
jgi:hypothetical protein